MKIYILSQSNFFQLIFQLEKQDKEINAYSTFIFLIILLICQNGQIGHGSLFHKNQFLVLGHIHMHIALYWFLVLGLGQNDQSGQVGQAISVRVVRVVSWQYGLLWFDLV